jgi:hypothetical protein
MHGRAKAGRRGTGGEAQGLPPVFFDPTVPGSAGSRACPDRQPGVPDPGEPVRQAGQAETPSRQMALRRLLAGVLPGEILDATGSFGPLSAVENGLSKPQ